jgi:hypothetical protein
MAMNIQFTDPLLELGVPTAVTGRGSAGASKAVTELTPNGVVGAKAVSGATGAATGVAGATLATGWATG